MARQRATVTLPGSIFAIVASIVFPGLKVEAEQDQAPDPKFTAAMQKGEAALKSRRFEEALDSFKEANATQNKTSAAAFHGLGRVYHGLGAFKSGADSRAEGPEWGGGEQRIAARPH